MHLRPTLLSTAVLRAPSQERAWWFAECRLALRSARASFERAHKLRSKPARRSFWLGSALDWLLHAQGCHWMTRMTRYP